MSERQALRRRTTRRAALPVVACQCAAGRPLRRRGRGRVALRLARHRARGGRARNPFRYVRECRRDGLRSSAVGQCSHSTSELLAPRPANAHIALHAGARARRSPVSCSNLGNDEHRPAEPRAGRGHVRRTLSETRLIELAQQHLYLGSSNHAQLHCSSELNNLDCRRLQSVASGETGRSRPRSAVTREGLIREPCG